MNKRYKQKPFTKLPYILALVIVFLSVGYSAFGTDMNISNIVAKIRLKKDVRITSVTVMSYESEASSSYQEYNVNRLISGINLPYEDSTITFNVGIVNLGNVEVGLLKINNLPENLDYDILNYNLKDKICDSEDPSKCSLGASNQMQIKIKYKDDASYNSSSTSFSLDLELDLEPFYSVTYTNIVDLNYPSEVLGGDSLTVDFEDREFNFLKVLINDEVTYDYSFNNGVLNIYEVTGDVNIIDEAPIYLTNLQINGNSLQEGKNLFKTTGNVVGTITPATNVINSFYKWATTTDYIYLQKGTYTISYKEGVNLRNVVLFDNDKNYVNHYWSARSNPYTFTLDSNYYVRIDFERAGSVDIDDINTFYQEYEIQLEKGSVATEYETYKYPSPDNPMEIQSVGEKTANLLDLFGRTAGTLTDVANTTVRKFQFDKYYVGLTPNNYYYSPHVTSYSINTDSIVVNSKQGGYGIGFPVKVKANTAYTITKGEGGIIGMGYYTASGEFISYTWSASSSEAIITPENCEIMTIVLRPEINIDTTYKSIQLEEGTKATEYEPYGKYKIPIEVSSSGKNLFNTKAITNSNFTIYDDGRTIIMPIAKSGNGYTGTNLKLSQLCPDLKVGDTATLSFNTTSSYSKYIHLSGATITWYANTSKVITEDMLNSYVVLYGNHSAYGETDQVIISNIQIERGSVVTSYEPYVESKIHNIFIDEPLRKVGNTFDSLDLKTGQLVRNIYQEHLNFTNATLYKTGDNWQREGSISVYVPKLQTYPSISASPTKQISNMFKGGHWEWRDLSAPYNYILNGHDNSYVYLIIENKYLDGITDTSTDEEKQSAIKTLFSNDNLEAAYVLQSPITETIDIPLIKMNGYSNVNIKTTIAPSEVITN